MDYVTLYVKGLVALYVCWGIALYLDQNRDTVRKHSQSPGTIAVKLFFAPVVLLYIAFMVLTALPRYLWTRRLIGCFVGNGQPACPPGLTRRERREAEKKLAESVHQEDLKQLEELDARLSRIAAELAATCDTVSQGTLLTVGSGECARTVCLHHPSVTSCRQATIENSIRNTVGANSITNEQRLDESISPETHCESEV